MESSFCLIKWTAGDFQTMHGIQQGLSLQHLSVAKLLYNKVVELFFFFQTWMNLSDSFQNKPPSPIPLFKC